jgi:putative chitinase
MLTLDQFMDITPGADDAWIVALIAPALLDTWQINTNLRIAGFLGQVAHECQGFTRFEENLHYSPQGMMRTWPTRFPTLDSTAGCANNPEALANRVYGGRMGNTEPGDGWLYHGRGPIQITGKYSYAVCGAAIGISLLSDPAQLLQDGPGASSAAWFWRSHGCNELADTQDWAHVTRRINGGENELADRVAWIERFLGCMGGP